MPVQEQKVTATILERFVDSDLRFIVVTDKDDNEISPSGERGIVESNDANSKA